MELQGITTNDKVKLLKADVSEKYFRQNTVKRFIVLLIFFRVNKIGEYYKGHSIFYAIKLKIIQLRTIISKLNRLFLKIY